MFPNDDITTFPKSFVGLILIFSGRTALSLKLSDLVACPVHAMLLSFSGASKRWLIQSEQTLVTFDPAECAAEQRAGNSELGEMKES